MPLSRPACIPAVISFVWNNNIQSILDCGVGFGGYGTLFRQTMDARWGRVRKEEWTARLDGIEVNEAYMNPVWDVYNEITIAKIEDELFSNSEHYQLVFFGDVLEHFDKNTVAVLVERAKQMADHIIITTPNTFAGNEAEGERFNNSHEVHHCLIEEGDFPGFTRELYDNQQVFYWNKV